MEVLPSPCILRISRPIARPGAAFVAQHPPPKNESGSVAVLTTNNVRAVIGPLPVIPLREQGTDTGSSAPALPEEAVGPTRSWFGWRSRHGLISFLSSAAFHAALLGALAMIAMHGAGGEGPITLLTVEADTSLPEESRPPLVKMPATPDRRHANEQGDVLPVEDRFQAPQVTGPMLAADQPGQRSEAAGAPQFDLSELLVAIDADVRGSLAGRSAGARARLATTGGGTPTSEDAVERGLRWIMAQQRDGGDWRFNALQPGNRNPGTETSTTAATGLALQPFLGAGYTHREGVYQDVVQRGLDYLRRRASQTEHGADLQEGTMYAQGIATITLCEAYAMTGDESLRPLAEEAVRFIRFAQNQEGGGWRYTPGEPGDTTVTGWQLMALKSAQMAGIEVPSVDIVLVDRFLDNVQADYGARYGYMDPRPRDTCSAIGLLCRVYTGWRRDHPGLVLGVRLLGKDGPATENMYLNYYATQVMHHYGGEPWERWNPVMREHLVATQSRRGQESGSWHFSGGQGDVGGRLYNTAMAVMTLEVYYRHLRIYDLGF